MPDAKLQFFVICRLNFLLMLSNFFMRHPMRAPPFIGITVFWDPDGGPPLFRKLPSSHQLKYSGPHPRLQAVKVLT